MSAPETEHFRDSELSCHHCGKNLMHLDVLDTLETIRHEMGDKPLAVSSGYRCPEHNAMVSSTGYHGPHTTGRAVDILIAGPRAYQLVACALKYGASGIGIKQHGLNWEVRFIHLDWCKNTTRIPRPRIWSYK